MRAAEIRRRSAELVAGGDIAGAGDLVRDALAIQPYDTDLLLAKANIMLAGRQYRQALATLEELLERKPECAGAHFLLGNVYRATRVPREAARCYEAALELAPAYPGAHHFLGLCRQQYGDLRGAEAALEQACELRPELALLRYRLGAVQHLQGRFERAIAAYRQALRRDPAHHGSHSNLALALIALRRDEEALEAAREHLAHVPGHALALASLLYAAIGADRTELVASLLDHDRLLAGTTLEAPWLRAAADAVRELPLAFGDPGGAFTTREFGPGEALAPGRADPDHALARALEAVEAAIVRHLGACAAAPATDPAHPWAGALPRVWRLRCWAEGHDEASREPTHCHPRAVLSGLLYLDVPPGDAPRVRFNVGDEPYHGRAPAVVTERPVGTGALLLYPGYYFHRTVPATVAGQQRIRLAFDVLRA